MFLVSISDLLSFETSTPIHTRYPQIGNLHTCGVSHGALVQVREGDELQWPPLMTGSALGGAEPPPGAIPVAEAKNRLWKNFEEANLDEFG